MVKLRNGRRESLKINNIMEISVDNDFLKQFEYNEEKIQDELLKEIKLWCFNYLFEPETYEKKTLDEISKYSWFLLEKFNYYKKLKKSLKIKNYPWAIAEISSLLDGLTLSSSIDDYTSEKYINLITKDINHIIEMISFCHGIINLYIREMQQ